MGATEWHLQQASGEELWSCRNVAGEFHLGLRGGKRKAWSGGLAVTRNGACL